MTDKELKKILENHEHYLNRDCENYESMRADLSYADLHGVDLSEANLFKVNLYKANLCGADLSHADLRGAELCGADLHKANLSYANLTDANLRDADLHKATLNNACLRAAILFAASLSQASLVEVDLSEANLYEANLTDANLGKANLSDAILYNADLKGAFLQGAVPTPYVPTICPEEGEFIGWKKAISNDHDVIVKLKITSDAKRSGATTRKCRCSKAEVLAIYNLDGTIAEGNYCHSIYNEKFIYEIGKTVTSLFDEDRWVVCTKGIHFFMNRQEAIDYDPN